MLQWNLRKTVEWIMEQETGVLLQTEEMCTKTGERVMEVMHTKQPDARPPAAANVDIYSDHRPELVPCTSPTTW